MQFHALAAVAALLATTQASSISDYYGKDCGLPINKIQEGSTPTECTSLPPPQSAFPLLFLSP